MAKTKIFFSKNVPKTLANQISVVSGYDKVACLGMCLGFLILNGRITKATYSYILDKVRARLSGWVAEKLSMVGRLTLIHSIISAIPFYAMQTTPLPVSLCNELDRLCRNFLWSHSRQGKKIHNAGWHMVTRSKEYDGLNLKPSKVVNQTFLLKMAWRMISNKQALWARVLQGKYIESDSLNFADTKSSNLSPLWAGLLDMVPVLQKCCAMSIGLGLETSFLYDNWLEGSGPWINHMMGVEEEYLRHYTVKDFYKSPFCDKEWLIHRFPPHIVNNIVSFHPPVDDDVPDTCI